MYISLFWTWAGNLEAVLLIKPLNVCLRNHLRVKGQKEKETEAAVSPNRSPKLCKKFNLKKKKKKKFHG